MARVSIKTEVIQDWTSFHEEFKRAMGFPDFYGMNMDAWIDCLTYLYDGDGMSRFHLAAGEMLLINPGERHTYRAEVATSAYLVYAGLPGVRSRTWSLRRR